MISLRYHAISLGAVLLALALGVVLGSTSLSNALFSGLSGEKDQLAQQVSDLQAQRNALNAGLAADDRFATGVGPLAVAGQLTARTVVLVSTANASQGDRDALRGLLTASGATVTGEVRLTDAFTDPNRADQLRDLVTRLIPAGTTLPVASDPGTLAGGLFGALLLLNKDTNNPQATANERAAALSGLATGGFVVSAPPPLPAQLVIVLTGGAQAGDSAADRAAMLARFATQLRRSGAGAVLAGGASSANGTGPIGVVRADGSAAAVLSTVDDVNTAAGRVVTVLALREQLTGKAGGYGTAGNATAPMPVAPVS